MSSTLDAQIQAAIDVFSSDIRRLVRNEPELKLSLAYDIHEGGVRVLWRVDSKLEFAQQTLPFATFDRGGLRTAIILRNKVNSDIVREGLAALCGASCSDLIVDPNGSTTAELKLKLQKTRAEECQLKRVEALIHAALEENGTTTVEMEFQNNSNIRDWGVEGQLVFQNDKIHEQLWTFHASVSSTFPLLFLDVASLELKRLPWVCCDVQTLFFEDAYRDLYYDPDQGFATSLFVPFDKDEDQSILFVQLSRYVRVMAPEAFHALMHFKWKVDTGEGYLLHRYAIHSLETLELNAELSSLVPSAKIAEALWDIRLLQLSSATEGE